MSGLFLYTVFDSSFSIMKLLKWHISPKTLLVFSLLFMAFVPIGVISHELGHVAMGEYLGYDTELHYDSVTHSGSPLNEQLRSINLKNKEAIINGQDFPDKAQYYELLEERANELFLFSAGGPIQTCLTGLIGLLILFIRKPHKKGVFTKLDWLAVFLSLFWLREIFNLIVGLAQALLSGSSHYFGGDELSMASFKGLPPGTFAVSLGFIGALVALYITFRVVPAGYRASFVLGGFIGSAIGFVGWMYVLGPILLP